MQLYLTHYVCKIYQFFGSNQPARHAYFATSRSKEYFPILENGNNIEYEAMYPIETKKPTINIEMLPHQLFCKLYGILWTPNLLPMISAMPVIIMLERNL